MDNNKTTNYVKKNNINDFIYDVAVLYNLKVTKCDVEYFFSDRFIKINRVNALLLNNIRDAINYTINGKDTTDGLLPLCMTIERILCTGTKLPKTAIRNKDCVYNNITFKPMWNIETLQNKFKSLRELDVVQKAVECLIFIMRDKPFTKYNNMIALIIANKILLQEGKYISLSGCDWYLFNILKDEMVLSNNKEKELRELITKDCIKS